MILMKKRILFVEDDAPLRTTVGDRLRGEGYAVDTAVDGEDGFGKATSSVYDLIILDVILPYRSGFDLCRDLRQEAIATPILFLTARHQTLDKVIGFKLGADDYVTKPFEATELLIRVEALLRRVPRHSGQGMYDFGSIRVDLRHGEVTRDGRPISLSGREFQLLRYFIEHPGVTVSRAELLESIWGYSSGAATRTVDTHVARLRQKLNENSRQSEFIATVPGAGYKFLGSSGN